MAELSEGRMMFLDESIPTGALDTPETEALWDQCVRIWGSRAHDEWERFKAQAEAEGAV
jgi:hypothetical protein